jgi:hypothetical protein
MPSQDPVIPLLVGGLVAVSVLAAFSIVVWLWAVRRPAPEPGDQAEAEDRPLVYVAMGAQFGLGLDNDVDGGRNWVELLREKMPEGTRLITLGRRGVTLGELNKLEISAAVQARPDIITLWSVVSDATRKVALADYLRDLHMALTALCRGTRASILLLNLPDISIITPDMPDEQRALVRGGVAQWNRAIADAVRRYGRRVRVVDTFPSSEQLLEPADGSAGQGGTSERNALLAELVWHTLERERLLDTA